MKTLKKTDEKTKTPDKSNNDQKSKTETKKEDPKAKKEDPKAKKEDPKAKKEDPKAKKETKDTKGGKGGKAKKKGDPDPIDIDQEQIIPEDEEELELFKDSSVENFNTIQINNNLNQLEELNQIKLDEDRYLNDIETDIKQKNQIPIENKINFDLKDCIEFKKSLFYTKFNNKTDLKSVNSSNNSPMKTDAINIETINMNSSVPIKKDPIQNNYQIETHVKSDNYNDENNDVILNSHTPQKINIKDDNFVNTESGYNLIEENINLNTVSDINIERINTNSDFNSGKKKNQSELPDNDINNEVKFIPQDLNINHQIDTDTLSNCDYPMLCKNSSDFQFKSVLQMVEQGENQQNIMAPDLNYFNERRNAFIKNQRQEQQNQNRYIDEDIKFINMKLFLGVREYDDKETKRKIDENKMIKILEDDIQTGINGKQEIVQYKDYFEILMTKPLQYDIYFLKIIYSLIFLMIIPIIIMLFNIIWLGLLLIIVLIIFYVIWILFQLQQQNVWKMKCFIKKENKNKSKLCKIDIYQQDNFHSLKTKIEDVTQIMKNKVWYQSQDGDKKYYYQMLLANKKGYNITFDIGEIDNESFDNIFVDLKQNQKMLSIRFA